jgi:hypothetical protein
LVYFWSLGTFFTFWYIAPREIWQPWTADLISFFHILSCH